MKNIKYLLLIILVAACQKNQDKITSIHDYDSYLIGEKAKTTSKYFKLWNDKIKNDSLQLLSFGNVASEYNRYFKETGAIEFLKKAEQSLKKAVEIASINKEGYLRALARNYISQHRFKEALQLALTAQELGGGSKQTQSLLFDVQMELGNYAKAEAHLENIRNPSEFGYLIRAAKWNDHKGDLDTTIRLMEKAMAKAESSKNKDLMLWSYTNIADYYGHAGRIQDSYDHYLKALAIDNQNAYAKKGIAWIVFSHEKNPKEALRILDAVTENYTSPDYYMLKAEIAEYMGNSKGQMQHLDNFVNEASNEYYGAMYNGYQVEYYLIHTSNIEKAFRLAQSEVDNRATPESYNLLATAYLQNEEYQKALDIVEAHIMDKTYEPAILLNAAKIYKANQNFEIVEGLKTELIGAGYELGPASLEEIQRL